MKLEIKIYQCLCGCETFKINEKEAYEEEFGRQEDISPSTAEPYGCGNMQFIRKPATTEILNKYKITLEEYNKICDELEQKLSLGACGWCI